MPRGAWLGGAVGGRQLEVPGSVTPASQAASQPCCRFVAMHVIARLLFLEVTPPTFLLISRLDVLPDGLPLRLRLWPGAQGQLAQRGAAASGWLWWLVEQRCGLLPVPSNLMRISGRRAPASACEHH